MKLDEAHDFLSRLINDLNLSMDLYYTRTVNGDHMLVMYGTTSEVYPDLLRGLQEFLEKFDPVNSSIDSGARGVHISFKFMKDQFIGEPNIKLTPMYNKRISDSIEECSSCRRRSSRDSESFKVSYNSEIFECNLCHNCYPKDIDSGLEEIVIVEDEVTAVSIDGDGTVVDLIDDENMIELVEFVERIFCN